MKNEVNINIKLDEKIKNEMEAVCLEMGLSMSETFNVLPRGWQEKDAFLLN